MAIYFRAEWGQKKQTAEIAISQVHSSEIWGAVSRNSATPAVKAKPGLLPEEVDGVEFETEIPPLDNTGAEAFWYPMFQKKMDGLKLSNNGEFAQLTVKIRKVRYTHGAILKKGVDWKP